MFRSLPYGYANNDEQTMKPAKKTPEPDTDQLDLFLGELFAIARKDDVASMEHPMFSIRKGGDKQKRRYEHNGYFLEITPSVKGSATIWDKDILIYVFTLMRQRLDSGDPVPERFEVSAADLLRAIGRDDSGATYKLLYDALERLQGTVISTNLPCGFEHEGEETVLSTFAMVDSIHILRDKKSKKLTRLLVKPSDWFRRQVEHERILTISPEYFQIQGGLERRLYELARKHCGDQTHWRIGLETLQKKVGATSELKRFRHDLRELIGRSSTGFLRVIDYLVILTRDDMVHVFADSEHGRTKLLKVKFAEENAG